jgi:hypothetical protein
VLLAPFNALVESDEVWFQRLVPGVLAVLIYGFGGMVLANSLPGRNRTGGDWRQSAA